ncbi:MAG: aminoacyl-tRNA hydrolase [Fimbriimonadaceae bacterium]|nr:aminoacyl-tRNA hydrolase [Fimbriimonadaceae bacterium]
MIVGLGNPGPEYRGTRHNVGFDVVDLLAERHRIKLNENKHRARYGVGTLEGEAVALVKPMTYMNRSGEAVSAIAKAYGVVPAQILVITDDLDLPVGKLRMKPKGSAGGHNGHRSIIASLGTTEYPRIKIGIGSVDKQATVDHVLSPFHPDERDVIRRLLERSADGVAVLLREGLERAISAVNSD